MGTRKEISKGIPVVTVNAKRVPTIFGPVWDWVVEIIEFVEFIEFVRSYRWRRQGQRKCLRYRV